MSNLGFPLASGGSVAPAVTISGSPTAGLAGREYDFRPSVTAGGTLRALNFSLAGTLPEGLVFSSRTGSITGTVASPSIAANLAITVTDGFSSATLSNLSIPFAGGGIPPVLKNDFIDTAGDSRTANGFQTARDSPEGRGPHAWAWSASAFKFRFINYRTLAVSGENSAQVLARIDSIIGRGAGTLVLWTGAADYATGLTLQNTIDNVTAIINKCRTAGMWVVLADESPRTGAYSGLLQQFLDTHTWLANASLVFNNVKTWPMWDLILDPATGAGGTGTYQPKAGLLFDGTHPSEQGAQVIGASLGTVLASHMTGGGFGAIDYLRAWSVGDPVWGATYPALNGNPAMTGTTGSKGAGVTGSLADNYGATRGGSGISVACTKETIGGFEYQVFTGSGTTAGTNDFTFYDAVGFTSLLGLAEGDRFDSAAQVILAAGATGVKSVFLESNVGGTTPIQTRHYSDDITGSVVTPDGFNVAMLTPPALITAGATQAVSRVTVKLVPSATVSFVLKVAKLRSRKVAAGTT